MKEDEGSSWIGDGAMSGFFLHNKEEIFLEILQSVPPQSLIPQSSKLSLLKILSTSEQHKRPQNPK